MRWLNHTAALALALVAMAGCGKSENEIPNLNVYDAARIGEMDALRAHVTWGADLNKPNRDGNTPLTLAIHNGKLEAVKFLLESGAKPTQPDARGRTPMGYATSQPSGAPEMIAALLDKGLDVNDKTAGDTALHSATWQNSLGLVKLLISRKADPDVVDSEQRAPLHIAASRGYTEVAAALVNAGAQVNAQDNHGDTPLHRALDGFISSALPAPGTQDDRSQPYVVLIRQLLEKGADPDLPGAAGRTGLHLAVASRSESMVDLLLSKGASTKAGGAESADTPLHIAIKLGTAPIAATLIEKGADVNAVAGNGRTPLQMAVGKGSPILVQMLLKAGANPAAKGTLGKTPLEIAQTSTGASEIARLLQAKLGGSAAGSPLHQAVRDHDADAVKKLLAGGASPAAADDLGQTPLHVAITWVFQDERPAGIARAMEIAKLLLDTKAPVNAKDKAGFTPLNFAVQGYATARVSWSRERADSVPDTFDQVAKMLLDAGADLNSRDNEQQTALHQSAKVRARGAAAFLLRNKADPKLRDAYGRLPADWARESNDVEIRRLLPD